MVTAFLWLGTILIVHARVHHLELRVESDVPFLWFLKKQFGFSLLRGLFPFLLLIIISIYAFVGDFVLTGSVVIIEVITLFLQSICKRNAEYQVEGCVILKVENSEVWGSKVLLR